MIGWGQRAHLFTAGALVRAPLFELIGVLAADDVPARTQLGGHVFVAGRLCALQAGGSHQRRAGGRFLLSNVSTEVSSPGLSCVIVAGGWRRRGNGDGNGSPALCDCDFVSDLESVDARRSEDGAKRGCERG